MFHTSVFVVRHYVTLCRIIYYFYEIFFLIRSRYLLEDGLSLWLAVLHMSSSSSHDLLSIFTHIPPIIERSYEYLEICLNIIQTYHF